MEYAIAGLAVSLAVCLVAVAVLVERTRRRPQPHVIEASAVGNLEARMEELAHELQESMRRAEEETQRTRFLNQIGTTVDLDHVIETTLDAALALPHVDAALVRLEGGDALKPIASSRGFGSEEPDATSFFGQPAGWGARAVELSYRYRRRPKEPFRLRSAFRSSTAPAVSAGSASSSVTRRCGSGTTTSGASRSSRSVSRPRSRTRDASRRRASSPTSMR